MQAVEYAQGVRVVKLGEVIRESLENWLKNRIQRSATGEDLRAAIDAALAGKPPLQDQRPSIGCNIKWKG